MKTKNIYLSSLTSLAVMTCAVASANEGVYVPELIGGPTASVTGWIATPSSTQNAHVTRSGPNDSNVEAVNVTPGYDVGIEASLGYIFEDTANGIELSFRNFDTNDTSDFTAYNPISDDNTQISENLGYELTAFDLMISQFMNIGQHMQMRFSAGAAYVDLQQQDSATVYNVDGNGNDGFFQQSSNYKGWGPRLAIDARYDFGGDIEGLGVVAGGSVAYFLGDLDTQTPQVLNGEPENVSNDMDNQAVTNLRGNVGVDYVYFFDNDEGSTLGLEVGYQVDYYDDAIAYSLDNGSAVTASQPVTFSGPYVQLKGAF